MRIRYNIATHKKIDIVKYVLVASGLLVFSIVFIWIGASSLSAIKKQFRDDKARLKTYEAMIEKKAQDESKYNAAIDEIKKSWGKRIEFVNTAIDMKFYPYIERLNKLETLLPPGVLVTKVLLRENFGPVVQFNIAATTLDKLVEAYKAFSPYDLVIKDNETLIDGLFKVSLEIKLKDEKR